MVVGDLIITTTFDSFWLIHFIISKLFETSSELIISEKSVNDSWRTVRRASLRGSERTLSVRVMIE